jgi:hypothetical protein
MMTSLCVLKLRDSGRKMGVVPYTQVYRARIEV